MRALQSRKAALVALVALVVALGAGCRGGDGECSTSSHADVAGAWVLDMITTAHCDPDLLGQAFSDTVTVTQEGAQVTVEVDGYFLVSELNGTICGESFTTRGSGADLIMGCSGRESVTVSGEVEGDEVEGRVTFSQTLDNPDECFGLTSCSGAYLFTGERIDR